MSEKSVSAEDALKDLVVELARAAGENGFRRNSVDVKPSKGGVPGFDVVITDTLDSVTMGAITDGLAFCELSVGDVEQNLANIGNRFDVFGEEAAVVATIGTNKERAVSQIKSATREAEAQRNTRP